eukprot:gene13894-biopygen532
MGGARRGHALFPLDGSRGNRTLTRAWRGHGAGVARAIGNLWLGVARAWRGHVLFPQGSQDSGAGVARAWRGRGAGMSCVPRGEGGCAPLKDPPTYSPPRIPGVANYASILCMQFLLWQCFWPELTSDLSTDTWLDLSRLGVSFVGIVGIATFRRPRTKTAQIQKEKTGADPPESSKMGG